MAILKISVSTIIDIAQVNTGTGKLELIGVTNNNTPITLTTNGDVVNSGNILVLNDNQSVLFTCKIIAKQINSVNNVGSWSLKGQITRGSGNTDIVLNTLVKEIIMVPNYAIGELNKWVVAATANVSYGGLNILFTGDTNLQISVKCILDYCFVNI